MNRLNCQAVSIVFEDEEERILTQEEDAFIRSFINTDQLRRALQTVEEKSKIALKQKRSHLKLRSVNEVKTRSIS